jgi:hypothetical protein
MLKFANRMAVVVSVTMLAGAPVAIADPKPPPQPTKPLTLTGIDGESQSSQHIKVIELP